MLARRPLAPAPDAVVPGRPVGATAADSCAGDSGSGPGFWMPLAHRAAPDRAVAGRDPESITGFWMPLAHRAGLHQPNRVGVAAAASPHCLRTVCANAARKPRQRQQEYIATMLACITLCRDVACFACACYTHAYCCSTSIGYVISISVQA